MEMSQYNTFFQTKKEINAVLNSVSGEMIVDNDRLFNALQKGHLFRLLPFEKAKLYKARFIVSNRSKEDAYVYNKLFQYRENSETLRYTLVTTYACNLGCPYCYEESLPARTGNMSLDTGKCFVDCVVRDQQKSGAKRIAVTLYGGEPLLNLSPSIYILKSLDKLSQKKSISFHGSIISNGTLFTPENIKQLSPYIQFAQVTLEGGPEYHNKIRCLKDDGPTFDKILDSIKYLIEANIRVAIRIQVTNDAIPSLDECFEKLRRRGLFNTKMTRAYFFPILDINGVCSAKSFKCGHEYYQPALFDHLWKYGHKYGVLVTPPFRPVWETPYCSFVNKWAWVIDPEGKKYKCVAMVGNPDMIVGSIKKDSYDDLQLSNFRTIENAFVNRSGLTLQQCQTCNYLPLCDGGCAYRGLQKGSGHDMANPSCEFHGEVILEQLRYLCEERMNSNSLSD